MKKHLTEHNNEKALDKKEILLFKYLNNNKKGLKTKDDLMRYMKNAMSVMGFDDSDALAYYYAYTANYRPEGDYENLTKSEFKDYKTFKQKKTTNVNASQFTKSKIPFKGSNLEGYWETNYNNDWYYVVKSYGWYPIFLFINNKWYEVSDRFSSSTGKQIGNSRPTRYSNELKDEITLVSRKEIEDLMNGKINHEELFKGKRENLEKIIKYKLLNVPKFVSWGYWDEGGKAKFKVIDVKQIDEKILITIDVIEAGKREGQKLVKSDVSYKTGEIPQATPNKVHAAIKDYINMKFVDIIGTWVDEDENIISKDYFLMFKFKD